MSRINNLTGPRVQVPTPQAAASSSRAGFGSVLQQQKGGMMSAAAARPGDPLMSTGGLVVQSALASVGGSSHSGILNSYLSAVGRAPISQEGGASAGAAKPGSQQAEEQKVMTELAELSAATLNNSIFHMGNRMKVDLERE
ncbi:hypothetical protein [Myxococcus stipitatus]|uniref:hypothetical protein n=1 Tax=Myxococcus stipitatus TaxID=83455 RepID=UPI0030D5F3A7